MLFPRNPLYAGYTASFAPLFRYSALLLFTPTSTVLIALPVPQLSQLTLYCICTVYWIYRICTVDVGTVFVLYSLQESNLLITHCWVLWLPERSYYICLYCICTVSLLYLYYNLYSSLCCICTIRAPQESFLPFNAGYLSSQCAYQSINQSVGRCHRFLSGWYCSIHTLLSAILFIYFARGLLKVQRRHNVYRLL